MKLTGILCRAVNIIYNHLANGPGLIVPESTPTRKVFEIAGAMLAVLKRSNHSFHMTDRGNRYTLSLDILPEFLSELLPCVFDGERVSQVDGDFLKHAISHARVMLL